MEGKSFNNNFHVFLTRSYPTFPCKHFVPRGNPYKPRSVSWSKICPNFFEILGCRDVNDTEVAWYLYVPFAWWDVAGK